MDFIDFFDGVYQMARSSKWYDLIEYADANLPPTSVFLAELDEKALLEDQMNFWDALEGNSARVSRVLFKGAYHALPGVYPEVTAEQTLRVLQGKVSQQETEVKAGSGNPTDTNRTSLIDLFSTSGS